MWGGGEGHEGCEDGSMICGTQRPEGRGVGAKEDARMSRRAKRDGPGCETVACAWGGGGKERAGTQGLAQRSGAVRVGAVIDCAGDGRGTGFSGDLLLHVHVLAHLNAASPIHSPNSPTDPHPPPPPPPAPAQEPAPHRDAVRLQPLGAAARGRQQPGPVPRAHAQVGRHGLLDVPHAGVGWVRRRQGRTWG